MAHACTVVWCSVNVSPCDIICGKHMTLMLILQSDNPMQCFVVRHYKIVAEQKLVGVPALYIMKLHKNICTQHGIKYLVS